MTFSSTPGMGRVHRALGLAKDGAGVLFRPAQLGFIHGTDDQQCPVEPIQALAETFPVQVVPGGHRLDHSMARTALRDTLNQYRIILERKTQQ